MTQANQELWFPAPDGQHEVQMISDPADHGVRFHVRHSDMVHHVERPINLASGFDFFNAFKATNRIAAPHLEVGLTDWFRDAYKDRLPGEPVRWQGVLWVVEYREDNIPEQRWHVRRHAQQSAIKQVHSISRVFDIMRDDFLKMVKNTHMLMAECKAVQIKTVGNP